MKAKTGRVPKDEIIRREAKVWELRAQMLPYSKIAAEVGITVAGVSKIIQRVVDRITDETDEIARQIKADHLARYDHIYTEAIAAWHRSKAPRKKQTVTSRKAKGAAVEKTAEGGEKWVDDVKVGSLEDSPGEVSYLDTAMRAMSDAQKLAGISDKSEVEHKLKWYSTLPPGVSRNEADAMLDDFAGLLASGKKTTIDG